MKDSAVVLVSGGMDSVTALYDSVSKGAVEAAISFDYGARHHARELPLARWHAEKLGIRHVILPMTFIGEHFLSALLQGGGEIPKGHYEESSMKQTVVPFRNGIMLSVAAGFAESCGADRLVIAAHSGDHAIYPDCRETFMESMASAIRLGTYAEVRLLRPFIELSKGQIVKRGMELGVDFSQTWSCYVGGARHCGECGTCVERREAFLLAGVCDPTAYEREGALPVRPSRQHEVDRR